MYHEQLQLSHATSNCIINGATLSFNKKKNTKSYYVSDYYKVASEPVFASHVGENLDFSREDSDVEILSPCFVQRILIILQPNNSLLITLSEDKSGTPYLVTSKDTLHENSTVQARAILRIAILAHVH